MNSFKFISIYLVATVVILIGCENLLEPNVASEISPNVIRSSEGGVNSVLNSSYAYIQISGGAAINAYNHLSSFISGETWIQGGGRESELRGYENYTYSSIDGFIESLWEVYFQAIRDANIVIESIEKGSFSEEFSISKMAEARFIRGLAYSELLKYFGAVPLHINPEDVEIPRASLTELKQLIEEDLKFAASELPVTRNEFGKATKGASLAALTKYYLNQKEWDQATEYARQVINLGVYSLIPEYVDVFSLANEGNSEMIWVLSKESTNQGQALNAVTFPRDFPLPPNKSVYASTIHLFDDFVNSFEDGDKRKELIVTEYVSTSSGEMVQLLGNNRSLPLKYEFDPNSTGVDNGTDIPVIRYADILLSLAEALNEMQGPNQESIDLINTIRERASLSAITLEGYSQESLRNHILKEREWEFYWEQKSREDQIRHGVLVSRAQERGKINAQNHHVLYPIPNSVIDANPSIEQNPGF